MENKGYFSISEDLIPNGTEVYVFHGSNNNHVEGFEDGAYIKGTIVSHRLSESLSVGGYDGPMWCEYIYSIVGENGRTYEATYGSALVGSFFIRTQKDFVKYLTAEIRENMIRVAELNKESRDLSLILKSVLTDKMKSGDDNDSYVPTNDSDIIAALVSTFKYNDGRADEILDMFGDSGMSDVTPKGLR